MIIMTANGQGGLTHIDSFNKSNCSQGTESFRDQTGSRMTNTLRQADRENLRCPVNSYNYGGQRK